MDRTICVPVSVGKYLCNMFFTYHLNTVRNPASHVRWSYSLRVKTCALPLSTPVSFHKKSTKTQTSVTTSMIYRSCMYFFHNRKIKILLQMVSLPLQHTYFDYIMYCIYSWRKEERVCHSQVSRTNLYLTVWPSWALLTVLLQRKSTGTMWKKADQMR